MKRVFGIIFGLLLGTSCGFAESIWHFRISDSEVDSEHSLKTEVKNYSGLVITVNGQAIPEWEKRKIYGSDIFISSDSVEGLGIYLTKGNGNPVIIILYNYNSEVDRC